MIHSLVVKRVPHELKSVVNSTWDQASSFNGRTHGFQPCDRGRFP
jgi:hypothetical protein